MRKNLIGVLFAVVLIAVLAVPVSATDITVTATPAYVSFSSAPTTWTLNGITGDSKIDVDTVYYANPLGDTTAPSATVADGECQFTWTNDSSVNINIYSLSLSKAAWKKCLFVEI